MIESSIVVVEILGLPPEKYVKKSATKPLSPPKWPPVSPFLSVYSITLSRYPSVSLSKVLTYTFPADAADEQRDQKDTKTA